MFKRVLIELYVIKQENQNTHAVWLHSDSVCDVRENTDSVSSVLPIDEAVPLEVKADDVCF